MNKQKIASGRQLLKDNDRDTIDFSITDQSLGKAMPSIEKPVLDGAQRIDLPAPTRDLSQSFIDIVEKRRSHRKFSAEEMPLEDLAYLLYCANGVRDHTSQRTFRHAPSAGNRHPFETYVAAHRVTGLDSGIYRYLPLSHQLVCIKKVADLPEQSYHSARQQKFAKSCAANIIWTCLPYRTEWRYDYSAHKVIAIDIGHVCQNLYLACTAIGYGTCAIAAYDQAYCDQLLGVDGEEEFTIYMSPVGKI